MNSIVVKIKKKLWGKVVSFTRNKNLYPYLYVSYWHSFFNKSRKNTNVGQLYFTAQPNLGAGIGHQMANWIAGYWFAEQFQVKFAHLPFSSREWDDFLAFGENEVKVDELMSLGYKKIKLPLFKEDSPEELEMIKKIVNSYKGKKVVLLCEQDQFYRNQFGVMDQLKDKFFNSPVRNNQELIYDKNYTNIAIHVRRGDILSDPNNPNLQMRYISNDYFKNILVQVIDKITTKKAVRIYFFSQGVPDDFSEFKEFENLNWCLDMGAQESFLHMVYADILITSKSSFSYKPALLNKGIKVCPQKFWHSYPNTKDWILTNNEGEMLL